MDQCCLWACACVHVCVCVCLSVCAGFSEAQMDPNLQATVKKVNRLTEPKKKSGGRGTHKSPDPVHNAIQTQLKAHGHHGYNLAPTSSVQPSSTSTPNCKGPDKVRKVARVTSQGSKPSKSGAKSEWWWWRGRGGRWVCMWVRIVCMCEWVCVCVWTLFAALSSLLFVALGTLSRVSDCWRARASDA